MRDFTNDHAWLSLNTATVREQRDLLEQLEATFLEGDADKHMPRAKTWVDGVKQFWSRVTS